VIEPDSFFRGLEAVLDRPPVAFDRHQRFIDVPAGHQVVKKAKIAIGDVTRISRPRVHKPSICTVEWLGSSRPIRDNTNRGSRGPFVPAPADRRFQSDERRVRAMSAAVPATAVVLPPDRNT